MPRLRPKPPAFLGLAAISVLLGAASPVVQIDNHGRTGRVVITAPHGVKDAITQTGNQLTIALPGSGTMPTLPHGPHNVMAIEGGRDKLVLTLAPGSHAEIRRGPHQLVLDIHPAPDGPPAPPPALDISLVPVTPPRTPQAVPAPQPLAQGAAPALPVPLDTMASDALVARRLPGAAPAILLPFGREVGAAAFERSNQAIVVFDDSKPLDLAALKDDPVFAAARVKLLQTVTLLTLPARPGSRLALHRHDDGWEVAFTAGPRPAGATPAMEKGALAIACHAAAGTAVLTDDATGGRLLVGTVTADDNGVSAPHASPEFTLWPTQAGVVVAPNSDRLALRATKAGFLLATTTEPNLASVAGGAADRAWGEAADLTRHFDFVPLPASVLFRAMREAVHGAAAAPPQARLPPRLHAAQAMLSLGLAREAAGSLTAALRDDPGQAAQPDARALLAMAHFLAGAEPTPEDSQAMANPALGHSDEITLWRAAMQPADAAAAAHLAATWRLLLAYPLPLRHHLVLPVAEALARFGQSQAEAALVTQIPDPALDPARAALLAKAGDRKAALALLDRIAAGSNRKQAAAAARDATELRLAAHEISPAQAADSLDRHLYAWRDDATEIEQRLRIAALRADAGQWRQSLTGLRTTAGLFPEAQARVHTAQSAIVTTLLEAGQAQHLAPLDLVALVEESADLLGSDEASSKLAPVLADKLMALDLPDRAAPILNKLMQATSLALPRAELGAKLAALRMDQGEAQEAERALDQSDAPDLADTVRAPRAVLRARALASQGQNDAALAQLSHEATPESLALQTKLLEKRNDWHGAEIPLQALVQATMPADGPLTVPQQDLILQLASDAARAADMAVLQRLQPESRRLTAGNRALLFQALMQAPVQGLADLPRSAREADAARAIPAALAGYPTR